MKFLKWFIGIFSFYASSFERRVDKFFKSIKSNSASYVVKEKLLKLMQEDLVTVNLWMEKKYKGYRYLTKKIRRKMYLDSRKIVEKFNEVIDLAFIREEEIGARLSSLKINYHYKGDRQLAYLYGVMQFLRPGKFYHYIKTASFGKLLRDPNKVKLEGDCNQIVTLYIYLFAQKFDILDLQIKLLPEHVCLHYKGIDIEATNGTFQKYTEYDHILPVTEIISTNLLDMADFREKTQEIKPRVFLKAQELAYAISSLKEIVTKNLKVAYNNLAVQSMKSHDFDAALFYFAKLGDKEKKNMVYKNAAAFYSQKQNFKKALYYAKKLQDADFLRSVRYNYGVYLFRKESFKKALSVFVEIRDEKMQKACYSGMYNQLYKKVKDLTLISDLKKHKSRYKSMLDLAYKMGDQALIDSLKNTLKQI